MKKVVMAACASVFLLGLNSVPAQAAPKDPISKAVSGKTLVRGNTVLKVRKNGKLTGKGGPKGDIKFKGAWVVRDGQWCRTLSEPKKFAGTECQDAVLGDGILTITSKSGPQEWKIK